MRAPKRGSMELRAEVEAFLRRWASAHESRDAERAADLFQRSPAPLATFTDGQRAADWLDVRVRLGRDFERAIIDRIDVHHVEAREVSDEAVACSFVYEMHLRDLWGTGIVATRLASFTLARTKDGFRIAQAHFSAAP